jgi:RecA-family ATPase
MASVTEQTREKYNKQGTKAVDDERNKYDPPAIPPPLQLNYEADIAKGMMTLDDIINMEIPERVSYLAPWCNAGTLTMIYAKRGVGKTFMSLFVALAITRGVNIGPWKTVTPADVLYVDGEMSTHDIQSRLRGLSARLPKCKATLHFLPASILHEKNLKTPNLMVPEFRDALTANLKDRPKIRVLILDNLSAMTPGRDENDKGSIDPVIQWMLQLRFMDIAVIIVHHAGKNAQVGGRGHSGLDDVLDNVILLEQPKDYKASDGMVANVSFTKARSLYGAGAVGFQFSIKEIDGALQ